MPQPLCIGAAAASQRVPPPPHPTPPTAQGNGQVVGLRSTQFGGRLQVLPIYHRQDILQIRSYPDFRWAAPPGQGPS